MKRLNWFAALFVLGATVAMALGPPPGDLHLENDHWTAWNPPEASGEVYIIQSGDTLWNLAQRFLGDAHLWPQIWEQNQYILDAHWIYPGDPLIVSGRQALADPGDVAGDPLAEAQASGGDLPPEAADDSEVLEDFSGRSFSAKTDGPVPIGYESDIYCSGYIGELEEEYPYQIIGSEYEFLTPTLDPQRDSEIKGLWGKTDAQKYSLGLGDILYVDGGRAAGLAAGELLTAVQPAQKIIHPLTGETIGRLYRYLGRLRILSAQESMAIAEIVHSCDPIVVGTALKLFEPEPVPLRRITPMRPPNYPPPSDALEGSATIIHAKDSVVALGEGNLVYLDQGLDGNLEPGDILTVYRRGRRGFPPVVMGEVGVLSVAKNSALARILRSRYSIYLGDSLLPK